LAGRENRAFTWAFHLAKLIIVEIAETTESVRVRISAARAEGKKIGLIPTMGALHSGHISLIEAAAGQCDYIVVSIFVNPTQFGAGEDFEKYPRRLNTDLEICAANGVDLVFAPSADEMYKSENLTWVTVEKLTEPLCGRFRPGHFRGVTTVCAKLFNIVTCDVAFFGWKDAQQAIVIKRMVEDLKLPLEIVVCPTVREPDGLAVSSRNRYLSGEQREQAASIYKALQKCEQMVRAGVKEAEVVIKEMRDILTASRGIEIQYIDIVDVDTLEGLERVEGRALVAVAVKIGSTRLIDNIFVETVGR